MVLYETEVEDIAALKERVEEAARSARTEMKNMENGKGKKRRRDNDLSGRDDRDRDDDVVEAGMPPMKKKSKHRS